MDIQLIAIDEGPDIPLGPSPTVVGRHPGCDAWLESRRVSRRHCCLVRAEGEVFVRDLGSTNGTWINGHRVEEGRLRPGDELAIGGVRYCVEVGLAAAPTFRGSTV
ncbi:MAG TPA: FHA domain-containing protein [Isosphaeraceae bacterium]|jgi:pSer/pThr/pTyr-binding forkhead associated (FHA) protein